MAKLRKILWILAAIALLIFLAWTPILFTGSKVTWSPALKVHDTLYISTGDPIKGTISEEDIAGRTKTYTDELPKRNGQSNILSENGLPYAPWEDGLAVEVDGEWIFFKKSETN